MTFRKQVLHIFVNFGHKRSSSKESTAKHTTPVTNTEWIMQRVKLFPFCNCVKFFSFLCLEV